MEQRLIDWLNGDIPAMGPKSVAVVLTNACNLNCVTCWSYSPLLLSTKPSVHWKRQHLSYELLVRLFEQLRELQTERVVLTGGGDPLAYPNFENVIHQIHQNNLKTTLISNLSLVRNIDTFQSLQIDTILANCSAVDVKSYVAFHPNQKPADYEKFMSILQRVSLTTKTLKLVFVVCRINAHLLEKFIRFAADIRAEVQFKLMSISGETQGVSITESMRINLLQEIPTLVEIAKALHLRTNLETLRVSLLGHDPTSFPIEKVGCSVGYFYARITASGDVLFCCNPDKTLKIGSLSEHSLVELWNGKKWQQLRHQFFQKQFVKGCERCGKFDLNVSNFQKVTLEKADTLLAGSPDNAPY